MAMITAAQMQDKLMTVEQTRERLAATEPLSQISFSTDEASRVRFKLEPAWNVGLGDKSGTEQVGAFITLNGVEYVLTKDAILEATSLIGLTKQYVERTPGALIRPHLDYWYRNQNVERKLLAADTVGHAFTKASIQPFSNLRLLDGALAAISEQYGTDNVQVDYKFAHDLRKTHMRLIVAEQERRRTIESSREDDDWSLGIQIKNSLVGETPLAINGYLFAWWCTNGCTSTHASSGNYNRRSMGQGDEVYEWARNSIDEILGGLESEFDGVQALTNVPIEGEVNEVLASVFSEYRVPLAAREHIISEMVETDDLTAYGLMQAVTASANHSDMSADSRDALMQIGGALPHTMAAGRCSACNRFMSS